MAATVKAIATAFLVAPSGGTGDLDAFVAARVTVLAR